MTLEEQQLKDLKARYRSGVLKVREGETWAEFQTMGEMRTAIQDLEREISKTPNRVKVSVSKGY